MKRSKSAVINVGGSSVLVIFAVLSLVIFSVLSLVSARADRRMVLRQENTLKARHKAEQAAEALLAEIDSALLPLKPMPVSEWGGEADRLLASLPVTVARDGFAVSISYEVSYGEATTKVVLSFADGWDGNIRSAISQWKTAMYTEEEETVPGGDLVEIID